MALTPIKMEILRKLAVRPQTAIDLVTPQNVKVVQQLVGEGYARDFAAHRGKRVQVRLRIWGITESGRAILEQVAMVEAASRQPSLTLVPKKPVEVKKKEVEGYDGNLWYRNSDGSLVPRNGRREKFTTKMKQDAKQSKKEDDLDPKV